MSKLAFAAALLLLPTLAFGAGFAKQSLFLSKSPVIEGDSVLIHAVVQNDSATAFSGEVVFSAQKGSDTKQKIGSAAASIAPQGAQAVSVSWKPLAGEYKVTASLTAKDGTVVEEESGTFTINQKPKPASIGGQTEQNTDEVQSSEEIQSMINKFSPAAGGFLAPGFSTLDSFRTRLNEWLDQGIAWSKNKVGAKTPGKVLGEAATKENISPQGIMGTLTYAAGMAGLYAFSVLKWIVSNAGIFYPVVALGFLYTLWRLFARIRRPSY
jgi:hypothetical protein